MCLLNDVFYGHSVPSGEWGLIFLITYFLQCILDTVLKIMACAYTSFDKNVYTLSNNIYTHFKQWEYILLN